MRRNDGEGAKRNLVGIPWSQFHERWTRFEAANKRWSAVGAVVTFFISPWRWQRQAILARKRMSFGTSPGAGRPGSPPFRTDEADKKPTLIRERHVPRPTHAPPPRIIKYSRIRERNVDRQPVFPTNTDLERSFFVPRTSREWTNSYDPPYYVWLHVFSNYVFSTRSCEKIQEILYISPQRSLLLRYREDSRILDTLVFIFDQFLCSKKYFDSFNDSAHFEQMFDSRHFIECWSNCWKIVVEQQRFFHSSNGGKRRNKGSYRNAARSIRFDSVNLIIIIRR